MMTQSVMSSAGSCSVGAKQIPSPQLITHAIVRRGARAGVSRISPPRTFRTKRHLNYDYSNFDGDGDPDFWPCLRVIAQRESLQGLNLYDTCVSDRGLKELAGMPNLTNLELSANPDVTDNGLVHLASIQSLRKLGLWGTSVTKTGVQKLQEALPDCEIGWDETSY